MKSVEARVLYLSYNKSIAGPKITTLQAGDRMVFTEKTRGFALLGYVMSVLLVTAKGKPSKKLWFHVQEKGGVRAVQNLFVPISIGGMIAIHAIDRMDLMLTLLPLRAVRQRDEETKRGQWVFLITNIEGGE